MVVETSINMTWCQPYRLVRAIISGYSTLGKHTREWLNLTHKITREQSQMPTENITFIVLSTLWQIYFSAIVENRAITIMPQVPWWHRGESMGWGRHGLYRNLSLNGFHPRPMAIHSLSTLLGFSFDWKVDFYGNQLADTFQ